jgi:hypothetical protein
MGDDIMNRVKEFAIEALELLIAIVSMLGFLIIFGLGYLAGLMWKAAPVILVAIVWVWLIIVFASVLLQ